VHAGLRLNKAELSAVIEFAGGLVDGEHVRGFVFLTRFAHMGALERQRVEKMQAELTIRLTRRRNRRQVTHHV
jgi:hypothetical protein